MVTAVMGDKAPILLMDRSNAIVSVYSSFSAIKSLSKYMCSW